MRARMPALTMLGFAIALLAATALPARGEGRVDMARLRRPRR